MPLPHCLFQRALAPLTRLIHRRAPFRPAQAHCERAAHPNAVGQPIIGERAAIDLNAALGGHQHLALVQRHRLADVRETAEPARWQLHTEQLDASAPH